MPADTAHPEYITAASDWRKCRDAVAGQRIVHGRSVAYLPKLSGQTDAEYAAYKARAVFYNATARTLDGLSGLVFRKKPVVEMPGGLRDFLGDVDMGGLPFSSLAEMVVENVLITGRAGVLIDYPRAADGVITLGNATEMGMRPLLRLYRAEQIVNWQVGRIGNATIPVRIVLAETVEESSEDDFVANSVLQYRVLELVDGEYVQRVFRQIDGVQQQVELIVPKMNGRPLSRLPFVFFGPQDVSHSVAKPPLLDLVEVNLSHYRTTADYEHGAHFTGLPTAVVTGHTMSDGDTLSIGGGVAWVFPEPEAKASYLEFKGEGLQALERLLDRKESQMASLGARMLAPEKRTAEAAETARIHRHGENSVLASLSNAVSLGLTKVFEWARDWQGLTGNVKVELNRDFLPVSMSAQDLTALIAAWQGGAIAKRDLFDNLKTGEIVSGDRSFEELERDVLIDRCAVSEAAENS
jgi:hypothetical protein